MAVTIKRKAAKPYPALSASPFKEVVLEYLRQPVDKAKRMLRASAQIDPTSALSLELLGLASTLTEAKAEEVKKVLTNDQIVI